MLSGELSSTRPPPPALRTHDVSHLRTGAGRRTVTDTLLRRTHTPLILSCPQMFRRLRRHLSLASLAYLCLSLGDDHDLSEAVEAHGRGHGKGPCDAIGTILKRHASTCFDIGAILKRRRRELQSDYWPKRTLETGGHDA